MFLGFGVLTLPPLNLAISVGLAVRSYNSVSTDVLHCDVGFWPTVYNTRPVMWTYFAVSAVMKRQGKVVGLE